MVRISKIWYLHEKTVALLTHSLGRYIPVVMNVDSCTPEHDCEEHQLNEVHPIEEPEFERSLHVPVYVPEVEAHPLDLREDGGVTR